MTDTIGKVVLLWRGDRDAAGVRNTRLEPVFEALAARGIQAEAAVYTDDAIDEVRSQLLGVNGVLVGWIRSVRVAIDPISTRCCATSHLTVFGSVRTRMSS
jgi:hypothetical protein